MAEEKKPATAKFDFAKLNSLAVVSFALSVAWVGAVAGVITGHFALAKIKATGERGRRLAIVSLILGYTYIGLSLLWGMFMLGLAIRGIWNYQNGGYGLRSHLGQGGFGQQGFGQIQGMDDGFGHWQMHGQFGNDGQGQMMNPNGGVLIDPLGPDMPRSNATPEVAPNN